MSKLGHELTYQFLLWIKTCYAPAQAKLNIDYAMMKQFKNTPFDKIKKTK